MPFPQTRLPILTEALIDGVWTDMTSRVRREDGQAIRNSRKPLAWGDRLAPSTSSWTFDNTDLDLYSRNPNSSLFGKFGRGTQVRHRLRPLYATFTGAAVNSWPAADTGQTFTNTGGVAGDYQGTGTAATHRLGSVNVKRRSVIASVPAVDVTVTISVSATATGAPMTSWINLGVDANNFYTARPTWLTDGTVRLDLRKWVAGVETSLITGVVLGSYAGSAAWTFRLQWNADGRIRVAGWLTSTAPTATTWTLEATDTSFALTAFAETAIESRAETGNTNVNPVITYDNLDGSDYRFWGEMPSLSPDADSTTNDKTIAVLAGGLGQRLGVGARPLRSALTRAMDGIAEGDFQPVAHWPMEEPSGATTFGNLRSGGSATISGTGASLSSYTGASGSAAVPTLSDAVTIAGVYPPVTLTADGSGATIWQDQFVGMIPSGMGADAVFLDIFVPDTGGDHITKLRLMWVNASTTFTLRAYDRTGTLVGSGAALDFSAGSFGPYLLDTPALYGISVHQSTPGGLVTMQFSASLPGIPAGTFVASQVLTTTVMPTPQTWRAYGNAVNAGWSFSHHALYTDPAILSEPNQQDNAEAVDGFSGELSGDRQPRLCREEGVPFELIGDAADTSPCGPQQVASLLTNLVAAADADQGLLYDARDALTLVGRTRTSLLNTTAVATLSHSGTTKDLVSFRVIDDFKNARNLITARRTAGSFAVAEVTDGGASTADPPDGIGVIPEDLTWNVATDAQLPPFAGWRAHLAGWDEPRYENVGVWRQRSQISGDPDKDLSVLALDLGGHLTITDPREDLPPDDIDILVQGYDEILANYEHQLTLDTLPYGPYRVLTTDDGNGSRVAGDHELRTAVNTAATSWEITTLSGPVLITADAADGWQWMVDGELVTVTDVAPSSITFVSAGTASSGANGSRTPGLPGSLASGDLVLILASTRNSGTGIPDTPTNWRRLEAFESASCVQLFGRIYDGVWTMPTITYTGGAANEDTIAQSCAFRGKFDDISRVLIAHTSCLNASAQDITAPGLPLTDIPDDFVALYLGWKQDDYTSVATPASWTEIQEASSAAGNDASQIWGYRLFTSRPAAGTLSPAIAVTGGAAAISRGAVIAIASDYQLVTVTRSVNGVSKSHAAGAVPRLSPRPYVAL